MSWIQPAIFIWLLCPSLALRAEDRNANFPEEQALASREGELPDGSQQRAVAYAHRMARVDWQEEKDAPSAKEILLALGGGTGAGTGTGNGKLEVDRDILRRMRYQDKLVLGLMLAAYFVALIFTASLAYRQASNNSRVKFYADPRVEHLVTDTTELEDFVHTFVQVPKSVQLNVQGLLPIPALLASLVEAPVEWQGGYYRHIFSFALDLTPFLVPADRHLQGLTEPEVNELRSFLLGNKNDLATVQLQKEVSWDGWEDLATNIKQRIRQRGFEGLIHVSWSNAESLTVYKNRSWANFLHMGVTRVLLGLSVVGYLWYLPYMWLRQQGPKLHPHFRVDMSISDYWQLIGDKISERGFNQ